VNNKFIVFLFKHKDTKTQSSYNLPIANSKLQIVLVPYPFPQLFIADLFAVHQDTGSIDLSGQPCGAQESGNKENY